MQVYQCDATIDQIPAILLRPLFGWKAVEMFSAAEDERARPTADVRAVG